MVDHQDTRHDCVSFRLAMLAGFAGLCMATSAQTIPRKETMMTQTWYERPLDRRAPQGGEIGVDDRFYRGGEIMPFYVPRAEMPQVDEAEYDELFAHLARAMVSVTRDTVDPHSVHPHQRVDKAHLASLSRDPAILAKAVLVSDDGFILDGHHRWAAHCALKEPLPVVRVGTSFEPAIALLFSCPETYSYGDGQLHPVKAE